MFGIIAILALFMAVLMGLLAATQWEKCEYHYMAVSIILCLANLITYASLIDS